METSMSRQTTQSSQLHNFSEDFLREQRFEHADISSLSSIDRTMMGLRLKEDDLEIAPLDEAELKKLSYKQKKDKRKVWRKENEAHVKEEKEKRKKENDIFKKNTEMNREIEDMLKTGEVLYFVNEVRTETASLLIPQNYVGGEDDVINTTMIEEMNKNPQMYGIGVSEEAKSSGFSVENLQSLKDLNDRLNLAKWRKQACDNIILENYNYRIDGLYDEMRKPGVSEDKKREYQNQIDTLSAKQQEFFNHSNNALATEINVMNTALQLMLSSFINNKHLIAPPNNPAQVKKRARFELESSDDFEKSYALALQTVRTNERLVSMIGRYNPKCMQYISESDRVSREKMQEHFALLEGSESLLTGTEAEAYRSKFFGAADAELGKCADFRLEKRYFDFRKKMREKGFDIFRCSMATTKEQRAELGISEGFQKMCTFYLDEVARKDVVIAAELKQKATTIHPELANNVVLEKALKEKIAADNKNLSDELDKIVLYEQRIMTYVLNPDATLAANVAVSEEMKESIRQYNPDYYTSLTEFRQQFGLDLPQSTD